MLIQKRSFRSLPYQPETDCNYTLVHLRTWRVQVNLPLKLK